MNQVNKTLYIPLYGKACVSKKGIILHDPKAEAIWAAEGFPLKGKSRSKWLAYYMGMRAAVFDDWTRTQIKKEPDSLVLHVGCGMDSRAQRIGAEDHLWYDVDFPEVIREREKYYSQTNTYHMLGADVREESWLEQIPRKGEAIVIMEGLSMYLPREALVGLLQNIRKRFDRVSILMDCYTVWAAKASKYKNPIRDVGVTMVYGIDCPEVLASDANLRYVKEHEMTPDALIAQLRGMEQSVFRKVFAGGFSKRLYRLYEFQSGAV